MTLILPHIIFLHKIKEFTQIGIAHGKQGRILETAMFYLFRSLPHWSILRPVKPGARIFVRIHLLIFLRHIKGLMRVKAFPVKEPVIFFFVML